MVRETLWASVEESLTVLPAADSAALINSAGASVLALRPFTVVRSRIHIFVKSDQTGALENAQVGYGIAVVSDQASSIGITAVPQPFTNLDSDLWLMHEILTASFIFVSGSGFDPVGGVWKDADSRAMRKVEDGQDLVFVIENSGQSSGSSTLTAGRVLLKLH